jgi:hypothetical protein
LASQSSIHSACSSSPLQMTSLKWSMMGRSTSVKPASKSGSPLSSVGNSLGLLPEGESPCEASPLKISVGANGWVRQ